MSTDEVRTTRWTDPEPPTEKGVRARMEAEGLRGAYRWSNAPGDVYGAHRHSYHKVLYVVEGSITFGLPERGREVPMEAGDRLDLPAGVLHDAVVGPQGVVCVEAHRSGA